LELGGDGGHTGGTWHMQQAASRIQHVGHVVHHRACCLLCPGLLNTAIGHSNSQFGFVLIPERRAAIWEAPSG
jgi:hypothetical protein